jgi:hypothetical protein
MTFKSIEERNANERQRNKTLHRIAYMKEYDARRAKTRKRRAMQKAIAKRQGIIRYGITPEDYAELLEKQNYVCAICSRPPGKRFRLSIDHDHDTGIVRGLLCNTCNLSLGRIGEDPQTLINWAYNAAFYLRHARAQ